MGKLSKYLLFAFLLENVAVQTSLLSAQTQMLFYTFMALGAVLFFQKRLWQATTRRTYWPFFLLALVFIAYEFTFGYEYVNAKTLTYLVAKIATFVIIIMGVDTNFRFYHRKMLWTLVVFVSFFIVYNLVTGGGRETDTGRLYGGYTNPNTTSGMGALVLGIVLFIGSTKDWKTYVFGLIGLYALLAGGSRSGMLLLAVLVFFRYGISLKIVAIMGVLYVGSIYVLPAIGLKTVGVERLEDTVKGKEKSNRDDERKAGWMMIQERPITGWGYEAVNVGKAAEVSKLGSHNGYIETLKYMGYPMGGLWIAIYAISVVVLIYQYWKRRIRFDFYLALLVAFSIQTFYESLLIGVHDFSTTMIFVAMAICCKRVKIRLGKRGVARPMPPARPAIVGE